MDNDIWILFHSLQYYYVAKLCEHSQLCQLMWSILSSITTDANNNATKISSFSHSTVKRPSLNHAWNEWLIGSRVNSEIKYLFRLIACIEKIFRKWLSLVIVAKLLFILSTMLCADNKAGLKSNSKFFFPFLKVFTIIKLKSELEP